MPAASKLTPERVAAAMEEARGHRIRAAEILGCSESALSTQGRHNPSIRAILEQWKVDPRYLEDKHDRNVAARANRGKTRTKTMDAYYADVKPAGYDLAAPLVWWEKKIINIDGLAAMLKDAIVQADDDRYSRNEKIRTEARAWFLSEQHRDWCDVTGWPFRNPVERAEGGKVLRRKVRREAAT